MDPSRRLQIQNRLNHYIDSGEFLGAAVSGQVKGETYQYTAGFQNVTKTKPFTGDTIIRIASDTKLVGTVAFLKLIDKGIITGDEPLKTWIPAFGQSTVINPILNPESNVLENPLSVTAGSNILTIREVQHSYSIGDIIAISGASNVQNIPASTINTIHTIVSVTPVSYSVALSVAASSTSPDREGGSVTILSLPPGSRQVTFQNVTYYYTQVPIKSDILIRHVLNHTLGYCYNILGNAGGYADNRGDPKRRILENIQAGIFQERGIPMPYPIPLVPGTYPTIKIWTDAMAAVPLLFHPGEDWSYGPTLSILGALIEYIDGRDAETYVREEVTKPLGMKDSGFFIQDDDPNRADKISRIQDLSLKVVPGFFLNVADIPGLGSYADYFYGSNQPRTLVLFASGMYSTLNDRNKFYRMLLNNGLYKDGTQNKYLISPAMVSLLSHNRINDLIPTIPYQPAKYYKWGLGVALGAGTDDGYTLAGQTKRNIFWSGLFGSSFSVDFTNQSIFNLSMNTFDILESDQVKKSLNNVHMASIKQISANDDDVSPNPSVRLH